MKILAIQRDKWYLMECNIIGNIARKRKIYACVNDSFFNCTKCISMNICASLKTSLRTVVFK